MLVNSLLETSHKSSTSQWEAGDLLFRKDLWRCHITAVKGERNQARGLLLKGEGKLFFRGEDYPPRKPEELTEKLFELRGKFIKFLRKNWYTEIYVYLSYICRNQCVKYIYFFPCILNRWFSSQQNLKITIKIIWNYEKWPIWKNQCSSIGKLSIKCQVSCKYTSSENSSDTLGRKYSKWFKFRFIWKNKWIKLGKQKNKRWIGIYSGKH